jgi:hypothetical protein
MTQFKTPNWLARIYASVGAVKDGRDSPFEGRLTLLIA